MIGKKEGFKLDAKMEKLLQELVELGGRFGARRLVLFGSRARGDETPKSDIDIAVYGVSNAALFNAAVEELGTLLKIDAVHVTNRISKELIVNIEREGRVLMDKFETKRNNFESALSRLKEACEEYKRTESQVVRDGVIQRFEFTTELAWKAAREYLLDQGYTDINSPKAVMKLAFSAGLVEDDTSWVELLNARNITSHMYDEQQADEVYTAIETRYVGLFDRLAEKLKNSTVG